ncbi:hypothetical protein EXIGLDRAFT_709239 [Exidia glandulosa HHB12029]|uniref:RRM domain-containing protein n=1 Tax=Exidia glandulosa HHB12029 TaxID=1314781 RepID=A0A165IYL8_EXIGL|nr:hypothetical protein EXIGLDRAFT_709239 [Exidia glandulosa HHB12029]
MTTTSTPDLSNLTLRGDDQFHDYDHFQTSPPIIPGGSSYNPFQLGQQQPKTPSRSGLPNQWLDNTSPRSLSPPINSSDISSGGTSPPQQPIQTPGGSLLGTGADDEIIPTAIVIKNIPFNVKRETLLDIIASLSIPTPYAFNYHLDPQGNFRGLAFANFRASVDADAVVAALNGFDVQGRKLRVEYKKVLQAGEKERIEREKALRRMRSMQLEKEHQVGGTPFDDFGPVGTPAYGAATRPFPTTNVSGYGFPPPQAAQSPPLIGSLPQQQSFLGSQPAFAPQPTSPGSKAAAPSLTTELDLNDPSTLEIYSRILLFKDDRMRDELAFSRSLAPKERRVVHLIAKKLGLYHYSVGEGAERYAVVTRVDPEGRNAAPRPPQQTLHRAPSTYVLGSHAREEREDTVPSLRGKKSMPDMKTLHTTSPRLTSRLSNGNIREGYATIAASSRRAHPGFGTIFGSAGLPGTPQGVPPVPQMPGGLNGGSGAGTPLGEGPLGSVVRQPRGPGNSTGFGQRQRVPTLESQRGGGLEARTHEPLEI